MSGAVVVAASELGPAKRTLAGKARAARTRRRASRVLFAGGLPPSKSNTGVLGETKVSWAMRFDVAYLQAKVTLGWASFREGRFSIFSFAHFAFAPFPFATFISFSAAFAFALRFPFSTFRTLTPEEESSSPFSFAPKASLPYQKTCSGICELTILISWVLPVIVSSISTLWCTVYTW